MRKANLVATVTTSLVLVAGMALAAGSDAKGKYYYKKNCKTCHGKGDAGGEMTPIKKTQAQWQRYFKKGEHNNGSEKLDAVVPAEQLIDIQTFLVNHAADSPQPETCG